MVCYAAKQKDMHIGLKDDVRNICKTRAGSIPGIEPGTSCTRSRNHTSRPNGRRKISRGLKYIYFNLRYDIKGIETCVSINQLFKANSTCSVLEFLLTCLHRAMLFYDHEAIHETHF